MSASNARDARGGIALGICLPDPAPRSGDGLPRRRSPETQKGKADRGRPDYDDRRFPSARVPCPPPTKRRGGAAFFKLGARASVPSLFARERGLLR